MKFKSLVTLVLTLCLVVLTSNAMAKGKKSGKSDKSYKYSEKSEKSSKRSGKRSGKGYGHCKSDKSGKGHKKKRGRGHDRDCDDDNEEPPVLVCIADRADIVGIVDWDSISSDESEEGLQRQALSITYQGKVCNVGDEEYSDIDIQNDDGSYSTCSLNYSGSMSGISDLMSNDDNFWYDIDTFLVCEKNR